LNAYHVPSASPFSSRAITKGNNNNIFIIR
jgi:hypothetical protein